MLDGLKVVQLGDVIATRDAHVYGSNPTWARNLRTFGEAGVVKDAKNAKTGNRGTAPENIAKIHLTLIPNCSNGRKTKPKTPSTVSLFGKIDC
jgi:hypothetical protein